MNITEIVCSIDDLCNGQFYGGHGHAFERSDLIGCLEFAPYVDKDMTNQDIENAIIENLDVGPWPEEFDDIEVTDKELRDAVKSEIYSGSHLMDKPESKPFKNLGIDPESEVQLFGYIHFYAVTPE